MKTTIKFFAALAISMSFVTIASAQSNTATANISGKAKVIQAMSVTNKVDLDFGWISQGSAKTIGLSNNVTGTPLNGTQTTGYFLVSAAPATSVDLTFTSPATLSDGASHTLPIGTYTYGYANTTSFVGASNLASGGDVTMPTNTVETVNGIYVFVGATVTPSSTQAIGDYTGNITLVATYN